MWIRPAYISESQSRYSDALGRALVLAQNFEQNCKFVLGMWDLGDAFEEGKLSTREERKAFAKRIMERMLGAVINRLRGDPDITEDQVGLFEAGRVARNYIAHEAGHPALYTTKTDEAIEEVLPRFIEHVDALARADNLVAGWSYMIQEEDEHMPSLASTYPRDVLDWILEPLRNAGLVDGPRS